MQPKHGLHRRRPRRQSTKVESCPQVTNKDTLTLSAAIIAENAAKIQTWYKRALTSNLKDDDDPAIDEAYADFNPLKKKYVDMADDYAYGILIEVFNAPTVNMLLESKRRETLKCMQAMLLLHVCFDPNDISPLVSRRCGTSVLSSS